MPDKVYVDINGEEVVSLEHNLEEHGDPVGGKIICRNLNGKAVVVINGGDDMAKADGGGEIQIQNGGLSLMDNIGKTRAIIVSGGDEENGGNIMLTAVDDMEIKADGTGASHAIEINASKRSIIINNMDGTELVSLEPNLVDEGGVQAPVGGSIICRSVSGAPVIRLDGGGEHGSPSGYISILDGAFEINKGVGSSARVTIHSGDPYAGEDGGTVMLNNPEDLSSSAIILNASKRSIIINSAKGLPIVTLGRNGNLYLGGNGTDGDIVLKDESGKDRILIDAHNNSLQILKPSGEQVVSLGKYGNLYLGGGKSDGNIILRNANGKDRITIGADNMKLIVKNDTENLVEIGGNTGNLVTKGSIVTEGNFKQQAITERSRRIGFDEHYDLFKVGQRGAFYIELISSYSTTYSPTNDVYNIALIVDKKLVLTYEKYPYNYDYDYSYIKYDFPHPTNGDILAISDLINFSKVGNNLRMTIGHSNPKPNYSEPHLTGTLSVTAYYGDLLDF